MDADDFPLRKKLGKNVQRHAVVGIVEGGNQNQTVGDIEIGVTGRQALATKDHRPRHRQLDQRELLIVQRAGGFEAGKVLGQRSVVGVAGIRLDGGHNGGGSDEAADVVDVAVRVVAGDSAAQPNYLLNA